MAIAQTRMIALLTIAEGLTQTLLSRQRAFRELLSAVEPDATREDLLSTLQLIQTLNSELVISASALSTLATERAHFKLHAARNDRLARKARLKRGAALDAPSITAPPAIASRSTAPAPAISTLAADKLHYNAQYAKFNMPAPYPDPHNDAEPLLPEHGGASGPDIALF